MWTAAALGHACYATRCRCTAGGLSQGAFPQWALGHDSGEVRYMEYPVLSGMFQYVTAQGAQAWHAVFPGGPIEVIKYFVLGVVLLAFMWMVAVWATYLSAGRRPWDTLLMAASPLVIFQAFTNYDLMAVAFASGVVAVGAASTGLGGGRPGVGGGGEAVSVVPVRCAARRGDPTTTTTRAR